MSSKPSHRDWVIFRANVSTDDPFFYPEFKEEIDRCRRYLEGPGLDQLLDDLRASLEQDKKQGSEDVK